MKFSMIAGALAALAGFASALTAPGPVPPTPTGKNEGNAIIKPNTSEGVTVGVPYEITWTPTTTGPVSLILLRGPSTNIKPVYYIAQHIPNSGKYVWTPEDFLEEDTTGYGIQLVVDADEQFQYSMQFGVKKPAGYVPKPSASAPPTYPSTTVKPPTYTTSAPVYHQSSSLAPPTATYTPPKNATAAPPAKSPVVTQPAEGAAGRATSGVFGIIVAAAFAVALF